MGLFRLASLAAISTLTVGACAHAQELPEGQGKAVVQAACSQCHGVDVIVGQPRSREEWGEVVSRMVGNDDYNLVIEYLAANLVPDGQIVPAKGYPASMAPVGK